MQRAGSQSQRAREFPRASKLRGARQGCGADSNSLRLPDTAGPLSPPQRDIPLPQTPSVYCFPAGNRAVPYPLPESAASVPGSGARQSMRACSPFSGNVLHSPQRREGLVEP
ncbi:hypothetical protein NN561_020057 [Cricetulus griseus]